jgi:hypothetical protein
MTFFHLDLILKYINGFTATGKKGFVFNTWQTFRQHYYFLRERKSRKLYVLPVKHGSDYFILQRKCLIAGLITAELTVLSVTMP